MPTFNVQWTLTLAAKNHHDAAEKARKIMKGSGSDAPYFIVAGGGDTKHIDLADEDIDTDDIRPKGETP